MSQPRSHAVAVNPNFFQRILSSDEGELLASFGEARLIKHRDGTCEIVGGTAGDRGEARDWVALFLQHVILREPRRVKVVAVAQPDWRSPAGWAAGAGRN